MRDSALKLPFAHRAKPCHEHVGEELMRDSALKLLLCHFRPPLTYPVGEELMRDSALKLNVPLELVDPPVGRRRAHARQRFETISVSLTGTAIRRVGEELMRDSALKRTLRLESAR